MLHDLFANLFATIYLYFECMLIGTIVADAIAAKHEPEPDKDFVIVLGCGLTLVEYFQHLYFGSKMFLWSPFYLIGLGAAGILLIVIGLIRPLREALERHFFF